MFNIGDKILYPMHGAGVIETIEEKRILGEKREYYILRLPCGDMKVMIPVDSCNEIGVRMVVSNDEMQKVLHILAEKSSEMSGNWNRRYRENMDKLKTGDIESVAEVVRNLMRSDQERKLSTGEKKMLANAKQILVSEMILVNEMDPDKANDLISTAVMEAS